MKFVKYMKTHSSIFVPGLGDLGTTLPSASKTLKLKMTDIDTAVLVEANNFKVKIPYGNISLMQLSDDPETAKAVVQIKANTKAS